MNYLTCKATKISIVMAIMAFLASCNQLSSLPGLQQNRNKSDNNEQAPSNNEKENQSKDGASSSKEEENSVVNEPVSVSGAYLTQCSWIEEDEFVNAGIGGCVFLDAKTNRQAVLDIKPSSIIFRYGDDTREAMILASQDDSWIVRFLIPRDLYGSDVRIDFRFNQTLNIELKSTDIPLTNLPTGAAADRPQVTPTPSVNKVSGVASPGRWTLADIKVGDDGFDNKVECPANEAKAKSANHIGRSLMVAFTVAAPNTKFNAIITGQCGHNIDLQPVIKAGEMQIWGRVGDSMVQGNTSPFRATTSGMVMTGILEAGSYELRVIPGILSNGSFDDFIAASVQLEAASLTVTNSYFIP